MPRLRDEIRHLAGRDPEARVTLVRSGALGDTILLLPAVELLRRALPSARITVLGSSWAESVAPLLARPWAVLPFESPALLPLFAGAECNDTLGVFRNAALAVIYTSDDASVFAGNARRLCDTVLCWPVEPAAGVHAACHFAAALCTEPPTTENLPASTLVVSTQRRREAERWLAEVCAGASGPLVVMHPGSGGEWKCWPAERFAELAQRLGSSGARVVLIEGPADRRACDAVCERLPRDDAVPLGRFECLERLAAVLSCAALYVGNDSGVTHVAGALGVPTLAVFGPTDPAVWRPLGRSVKVIRGAPSAGAPWTWPTAEALWASAAAFLERISGDKQTHGGR